MTSDPSPSGAVTRQVRTVVVVDDHTTFAQLLARALDAQPDIACVGQCQTAAEARQLVADRRPDVVATDLNLGDGAEDGLSLTRELVARWPDLPVVILTAFADAEVVRRASEAGASAVVPKNGQLDDMLGVLRRASPGTMILGPQFVHALLTDRHAVGGPVACPLTRRELEVLTLMAEGLDLRSVCRRLGISLNTGRGYVKSVLLKLDAHTQLEAVVVASRRGLIHVGP